MPRRVPLVCRSVRLPRRSCSSSKALNSELKLPAPKPWSGREKQPGPQGLGKAPPGSGTSSSPGPAH
ncbi:unnamed protein product [Gulo gulo]|uniref:Uncharacterized protein n=1 Tax=Gulo gulo TaxID=48420 RepID=A0A9X9Q335_GULGU|nr:unnamed protein product [Gulo gulo]